MRKKSKSIPIHPLNEKNGERFTIQNVTSQNLDATNEIIHSHRHDYHSFLLARKGFFIIEVDFERHEIKAPSVIYIHPGQVHRIVIIENVDIYFLGMRDEDINPDYLRILEEDILPSKSLPLDITSYAILNQTIILCAKISDWRTDKLYPSVIKDYCNAFVGGVVSRYLEQSRPTSSPSRSNVITREFKLLLESRFISMKRPSDYANALHISTPYLNECIRNATGFSASYHIQQRIILEAKRLLYYSDKSVKEIAIELGYGDYAYFSRLFKKSTGTTALGFRNKNLD